MSLADLLLPEKCYSLLLFDIFLQHNRYKVIKQKHTQTTLPTQFIQFYVEAAKDIINEMLYYRVIHTINQYIFGSNLITICFQTITSLEFKFIHFYLPLLSNFCSNKFVYSS